ncbi:hypothetical protein MTO96_014036 [Rhipicephalus appendiculatus]
MPIDQNKCFWKVLVLLGCFFSVLEREESCSHRGCQHSEKNSFPPSHIFSEDAVSAKDGTYGHLSITNMPALYLCTRDFFTIYRTHWCPVLSVLLAGTCKFAGCIALIKFTARRSFHCM